MVVLAEEAVEAPLEEAGPAEAEVAEVLEALEEAEGHLEAAHSADEAEVLLEDTAEDHSVEVLAAAPLEGREAEVTEVLCLSLRVEVDLETEIAAREAAGVLLS